MSDILSTFVPVRVIFTFSFELGLEKLCRDKLFWQVERYYCHLYIRQQQKSLGDQKFFELIGHCFKIEDIFLAVIRKQNKTK